MIFNPLIDQYLAIGCGRCPLVGTPQCKVHTWHQELVLLREIVLSCGLVEELKWKMPTYTHNGKNIVMMAAFVNNSALSFFKGSLLTDASKLLEKPGENSQSARFMKFTDTKSIKKNKDLIQAYIFEAIALEDKGVKVQFKKSPEDAPEELLQIFNKNPKLEKAFYGLTPGRQRGYILHFSQPKQSATRISRVEKCIPKIMEGRGFHD